MRKNLMIALLCTILTSYVSAEVVSFNIDQGIDDADYDYEFMVVSLIDPDNKIS